MAKKKSNFDFSQFLKELKTDSPKLERKQGKKPKRKYFLIVTEGGKTEPIYFNSKKHGLPKNLLETIEIEGVGANTITVVNKAIELKEKREQSLLPNYDEVWAIFDKDEFPTINVNEAVAKAERNGVKAGLANESFELWYVLHFREIEQQLTREQYCTILSEILGISYDKANEEIPELIQKAGGEERLALRRAKTLEELHEDLTPAQKNPYIGFRMLIIALNKYITN